MQIFVRAGGWYLWESPLLPDYFAMNGEPSELCLFEADRKDGLVEKLKSLTPARPIQIIEHRVTEEIA